MCEFDTPSGRQARKEARKRAEYADSQIAPGLKRLFYQASGLFWARVAGATADTTKEEIERIFDECLSQVPGSQEAFEIWGTLYDTAKVN